jgi:hypothetical protein
MITARPIRTSSDFGIWTSSGQGRGSAALLLERGLVRREPQLAGGAPAGASNTVEGLGHQRVERRADEQLQVEDRCQLPERLRRRRLRRDQEVVHHSVQPLLALPSPRREIRPERIVEAGPVGPVDGQTVTAGELLAQEARERDGASPVRYREQSGTDKRHEHRFGEVTEDVVPEVSGGRQFASRVLRMPVV